ncbi:MAG: hypothetical protein AAF768_08485 [Pseudomonadota bacterium]
MVLKSALVSIAALSLAGSAFADSDNRTDLPGEALAWTLAAYVSCDDAAELQHEIKAEVSAFGANGEETLEAMKIIAEGDSACGALKIYATDLVSLAATDMSAFENMLDFQGGKDARISVEQMPEGPATVASSLVESTVAEMPMSNGDQPSSDYQN